MKQNLGKLDRILRFALAVWWLGPFAPVFTASWANLAIVIIGWIALVESFLGYCAIHSILGVDNSKQ